MMRRTLLGASVLALLVTGCAEQVTAPVDDDLLTAAEGHTSRIPMPIEQQPTVDLTRGFTYAIFPEGAGQILAQTFTPSRKVRLTHIRIPVGCETGVNLRIRIRRGLGGPILSQVPVRHLPTVVDGTFQTIPLVDLTTSHGVKVKKNTTYVFELSTLPVGGGIGTCGIAPGPAGDSYAGGAGFFEDVPTNGPGFLPLSPPVGEDLAFVLWGY